MEWKVFTYMYFIIITELCGWFTLTKNITNYNGISVTKLCSMFLCSDQATSIMTFNQVIAHGHFSLILFRGLYEYVWVNIPTSPMSITL